MPFSQFDLQINGISDLLTTRHGIVMAGKLLIHFLRAAQVVLVTVHLQAA